MTFSSASSMACNAIFGQMCDASLAGAARVQGARGAPLLKRFRSICWLLLSLVIFSSPFASAQNVLMLTTGNANDNFEVSRAIEEFEASGATVRTLKVLNDASAVLPQMFTDSPGPYDIVVIVSVYSAIHASNWDAINAAIEARSANSFLMFVDGCDGCSVSSNAEKMVASLASAGLSSATIGSQLMVQTGFPLNTGSPYANSFANLDPFNGGWVTLMDGIPRDNALYLAPGATIPPTTPIVNDVFGALVPTTESYGGEGACVFATVDATLFVQYNGRRIAPAFIHAATAPGGACGLPTRVTKSFSTSQVSIAQGVTTLTISVENFTASDISGAELADHFPAPLQIAGSPITTCVGGSLMAPVGGSSLSLSNFTIPASTGCEVRVPVIWPATGAGIAACDGTPVVNTIRPGIDFVTPEGQVNAPTSAELSCVDVQVPVVAPTELPATRTSMLIGLSLLVLAAGARARRRMVGGSLQKRVRD
jgi:hypothetical protein